MIMPHTPGSKKAEHWGFHMRYCLFLKIAWFFQNLSKDWRVEVAEHCTEMRFASFLSGGFTTIAVINPPEKKLAKRTSVHCEASVLVCLNGAL